MENYLQKVYFYLVLRVYLLLNSYNFEELIGFFVQSRYFYIFVVGYLFNRYI